MAPQGSNWFWVPAKTKLVEQFYARIGVNPSEFKYQEWGGPPPAMPLSRTSYHFARNCLRLPISVFILERSSASSRESGWLIPGEISTVFRLSPGLRSDFANYLKAVVDYHSAPPHDSEAVMRRYDTMTAEEVLMSAMA